MIKICLLAAINLIVSVAASDEGDDELDLRLIPLTDDNWKDFALKHDVIIFDFYSPTW